MITISYHDNEYFMASDENPLVRAYLDVVRDTVCGLTLRTTEYSYGNSNPLHPHRIAERVIGLDWPAIAITMVGQKRLINLEWALRFTIAHKIPGDFIECGVWRGGGSIFARAVLKALNNTDKHVWLADSFQGLPKPRTKNDVDAWSKMDYLKVFTSSFQRNEILSLFL
jgi:O-methyltransferase